MVRGLYTAWTGLYNEQKRLEVIANNIANSATTGYKQEGNNIEISYTIRCNHTNKGWYRFHTLGEAYDINAHTAEGVHYNDRVHQQGNCGYDETISNTCVICKLQSVVIGEKATGDHTYVDDFNCETALNCEVCLKTLNEALIEQVYNAESEKALSGKAIAEGIANATEAVKEELLNGAGAAYDTLRELGDLIDTNTTALDALEQVALSKADKEALEALTQIVDEKSDNTHGHPVLWALFRELRER